MFITFAQLHDIHDLAAQISQLGDEYIDAKQDLMKCQDDLKDVKKFSPEYKSVRADELELKRRLNSIKREITKLKNDMLVAAFAKQAGVDSKSVFDKDSKLLTKEKKGLFGKNKTIGLKDLSDEDLKNAIGYHKVDDIDNVLNELKDNDDYDDVKDAFNVVEEIDQELDKEYHKAKRKEKDIELTQYYGIIDIDGNFLDKKLQPTTSLKDYLIFDNKKEATAFAKKHESENLEASPISSKLNKKLNQDNLGSVSNDADKPVNSKTTEHLKKDLYAIVGDNQYLMPGPGGQLTDDITEAWILTNKTSAQNVLKQMKKNQKNHAWMLYPIKNMKLKEKISWTQIDDSEIGNDISNPEFEAMMGKTYYIILNDGEVVNELGDGVGSDYKQAVLFADELEADKFIGKDEKLADAVIKPITGSLLEKFDIYNIYDESKSLLSGGKASRSKQKFLNSQLYAILDQNNEFLSVEGGTTDIKKEVLIFDDRAKAEEFVEKNKSKNYDIYTIPKKDNKLYDPKNLEVTEAPVNKVNERKLAELKDKPWYVIALDDDYDYFVSGDRNGVESTDTIENAKIFIDEQRAKNIIEQYSDGADWTIEEFDGDKDKVKFESIDQTVGKNRISRSTRYAITMTKDGKPAGYVQKSNSYARVDKASSWEKVLWFETKEDANSFIDLVLPNIRNVLFQAVELSRKDSRKLNKDNTVSIPGTSISSTDEPREGGGNGRLDINGSSSGYIGSGSSSGDTVTYGSIRRGSTKLFAKYKR